MSGNNKVKIKDSAARVIEGFLMLNDAQDGNIYIEVEGCEAPRKLTDLLSEYDGRSISMRVSYNEQLTTDELD